MSGYQTLPVASIAMLHGRAPSRGSPKISTLPSPSRPRLLLCSIANHTTPSEATARPLSIGLSRGTSYSSNDSSFNLPMRFARSSMIHTDPSGPREFVRLSARAMRFESGSHSGFHRSRLPVRDAYRRPPLVDIGAFASDPPHDPRVNIVAICRLETLAALVLNDHAYDKLTLKEEAMALEVRRIVTGHDSQGRAVVA